VVNRAAFEETLVRGEVPTCSASLSSTTEPRAPTPIARYVAQRSRAITSGKSARKFVTAAAGVSPIIPDWGNFSPNTVSGRRREADILAQTACPDRSPLLADAICAPTYKAEQPQWFDPDRGESETADFSLASRN
jgi:hypothetical protein